MTLQQEYREKYNEGLENGKMEGKIEILYCDLKLTISEIAERLELSEEHVQKVVDEIKEKGIS